MNVPALVGWACALLFGVVLGVYALKFRRLARHLRHLRTTQAAPLVQSQTWITSGFPRLVELRLCDSLGRVFAVTMDPREAHRVSDQILRGVALALRAAEAIDLSDDAGADRDRDSPHGEAS